MYWYRYEALSCLIPLTFSNNTLKRYYGFNDDYYMYLNNFDALSWYFYTNYDFYIYLYRYGAHS